MKRVPAFFVEEATECLDAVRAELEKSTPEAEALYRAVRRLRGSAQVARFGAIASEAEGLERALRPDGAGGELHGVGRERIETIIESLESSVEAVRDGRIEQDEREPMTDEQTGGADGAPEGEPGTEVMPLEKLEYQGDAALARAQTLREPLEEAFMEGDPPGGILDELFDLIRLGRA